MRILYYCWHVAEVSTPIRLYIPPWHIFPGDISPRFYDLVNVTLIYLSMVFQTIMFGLIVPDKSAKVARAIDENDLFFITTK